MRVVHYQRRPRAVLNHSIEQSFALVREALRGQVEVALAIAPRESTGLLPRLAIVRDAARQRADLVHVLGDITFAGLGPPPTRTIVTVLDTVHETWPPGLRRTLIEAWWLRRPARRGVHLAAISAFTADRVAALTGVPRAAIAVIPPAVDPRWAALASTPPTGAPTVLLMGTAPNKNTARALAALHGTGAAAIVVGPMDDAQWRAAEGAGVTVEQHDALPFEALRDAMQRAHVVLFPSTYEGFGMPIAEAHLAGRPVVTSDRAPMRDTAGGHAWLVDPEQVDAIAAGVRDALAAVAAGAPRLSAARTHAERYLPAPVAAQWAACYRDVAQRAGIRP